MDARNFIIIIIIIKAGSSTGTSLEVGTLDTLHMQGVVGLASKQKQRAVVLGASAVFDQREYLLLLLVLIRASVHALFFFFV
jgi:hypothetical protein